MNNLSSSEIREKFLAFFAGKDHQVIPSASLIPVNDPTLLWINSGVATLKKYFDGSLTPDNPRMTNSQKSIRTNDIENVGYTARHHTLFEMLGNFSIGDYFKEDAIKWAWEFLTSEEWMGFSPDKLYVTYYPEDLETKALWEKIPTFDNSHLVAVADNFWDIGAGPCGPDSEIFYDRGEEFNNLAADDPENYPGGENERWLEIWNLVFSEFNHMPDDTYVPLPHKNVDTGMGLERLTSVVQNTKTNFETDLFLPIIRAIEKLTDGISYDVGGPQQVSFKVIADHIRAVSFAISDGALPANEGRGYIIRRLIRRSVLHGRRLGITQAFLQDLVPTITQIMGDYYSELARNLEFVQSVIAAEENRFHETIEEGESHLQEILLELQDQGKQILPGDKAFLLYDTFGFPLELTEEIASEQGFTVDHEGFNQAMDAQRERARSARTKEDSMAIQSDVLQGIETEYEFLGYQQLSSNASAKAIVLDDQLVEQLPLGEEAWVFFNRSPFYAESGGQIADTGGIYDGDQLVAEVLDVKKAPNKQAMHYVKAITMPINLNQSYTLEVNIMDRLSTQKNHTGTHLLHAGLKHILGQHANQAGSYVGPDRLRFDFSHFGKISEAELKQIENYVNFWIENASDVNITEMPIAEAQALGAMALFGEKYGDIVRVVNVGNESIELCGGTHVNNTNDIGTFKIVSESGIGAGIRRIEALTGQAAINYYQEQEELLQQALAKLKVKQADQLLHRIEQLQEEMKLANSKIESLSAKLMQEEATDLFSQLTEVGDLTYVSVDLAEQSVDQLRNLGDFWRQKQISNLLIAVSAVDEKVNLLVFADDQAIQAGVKAGDLIKPLAKWIDGGGGGKPQMAQAGGKKVAGIADLIAHISEEIADLQAK